MPKLGQQDVPASQALQTYKTGAISFSGVRIEDLGATAYTLATITVDVSGSVGGFQSELEAMINASLESCKHSPRKDNLIARVTYFNERVDEAMGFTLLADIPADRFKNTVIPSGSTALLDATLDAIEASIAYGKQFIDNNYNVNGVAFIITDGMENASLRAKTDMIAKAIANVRKKEALESLVVILIGVNIDDAGCKQALEDLQKACGIDHFISIKDASKSSLAKLAQFVSRSISSTSQALGTGGPSKQIAPGQSLTI